MPGSIRRRRPVKRLRREIIERDHSTCRYCLKIIKDPTKITIDHVYPWGRGGLTIPDNLVVACGRCNQRKGNRTLKEARMRLWVEI
jgi:5-methylcytosine-specific restriction endonuclease McrA